MIGLILAAAAASAFPCSDPRRPRANLCFDAAATASSCIPPTGDTVFDAAVQRECKKPLGWQPVAKGDSDWQHVKVEEVPADVPVFKRIYTVHLDNRATLKVTMQVYLGYLLKDGELTQPDGRSVEFDPDNVAEKILDPKLVPLVQRACRNVNALDRTFRVSKPAEFRDESGVVWRRAAR